MCNDDIVSCPVCGIRTTLSQVNSHLDSGCQTTTATASRQNSASNPPVSQKKPFWNKSATSPKHATQPEKQSERMVVTETPRKRTISEKVDLAGSEGGETDPPEKPAKKSKHQSLAELARPNTLDEFIGQSDLVGPNGILRRFIVNDSCPSLIFWGPSGVGKTTLARIIAATTKSRFVELSATVHGVSDCKKIFEEARNDFRLTRRRTILFLDEVHRFNRAQQDTFLPHVEDGTITLIGATTENPSFRLVGALLSRCRVFVLHKLKQEEVALLLKRALKLQDFYDFDSIDEDIINYMAGLCDGDGRIALNMLEMVINSMPEKTIPKLEDVKSTLKRTHLLYDRVGDGHYDTISALHKSVRGNDANAALFYLGRMLQSGEDPLYVARRMVRMASEDIGQADESCLPFAVATYTAVQQVGMPEADTILAHCAVKLAEAKKSVRVYRAYNKVKAALAGDPQAAAAVVPIHLRNAPTRLMKELGYGKEYQYPPDFVNGQVEQEYLPETIAGYQFLKKEHLGPE